MKSTDNTLAARFVFCNCSVSIHTTGELIVSRDLRLKNGDCLLPRNFSPAGSIQEYMCLESDFYRFLKGTSPSEDSLRKKMLAIGYILCNKLTRKHPIRRGFFCVNAVEGANRNGKSLFAMAIAQFCHTVKTSGRRYDKPFWLSDVTSSTNLLVVEDLPLRADLSELYLLCTHGWCISRKCQPCEFIERTSAPHLMVSVSLSIDDMPKDGSFLRRFVLLEFASFFGPENPIDKYIGRVMFRDWDSAQWHMFDNLMFYCVIEYLRSYSQGVDVFSNL